MSIVSRRAAVTGLVATWAQAKEVCKVSLGEKLDWAYAQNIKPGTRKNIFVYLCRRANDLTEAWPSITLICKATGFDRDTVIESLSDLERRGRIEDTGGRKGLTRSVIVYRIIDLRISSKKNGTAKQSGFSAKQSEFSPKQSGFSQEKRQNRQKYAATPSALAKPTPPLDKSKIQVPSEFKAWVSEQYPDNADEVTKWKTWSDVPNLGFREEWHREQTNKLYQNIKANALAVIQGN